MKEKQSKCSIDIFLTMIIFLVDYIYLDYIGSEIYTYIYRIYFLRNIPIISLANYKEKTEIYTKYLEKKSNWVGRKYLRLHRWISQVGSVHFARKGWFFKVIRMVRKWNLNYEVAHVCLQVVSQLRNTLRNFRKWISQLWNFRNSFRSCEIFAQLLRLSSNGP